VTASASRERLELANEAGSLDLALDVADSIQAQDSLEKMLVRTGNPARLQVTGRKNRSLLPPHSADRTMHAVRAPPCPLSGKPDIAADIAE
jgi:hypothetical protein